MSSCSTTTHPTQKKKFTDTARFTLQCMICYEGLTGQQAAVAHAQKTGHTNFGEVGP